MKASIFFQQNMSNIKKRFEDLKQKYHCRDLLLFGSVARGEDNEDSDIDLAITTEKNADICDAVHIVENMRKGFDFDLHITLIPVNMKQTFISDCGAIEL